MVFGEDVSREDAEGFRQWLRSHLDFSTLYMSTLFVRGSEAAEHLKPLLGTPVEFEEQVRQQVEGAGATFVSLEWVISPPEFHMLVRYRAADWTPEKRDEVIKALESSDMFTVRDTVHLLDGYDFRRANKPFGGMATFGEAVQRYREEKSTGDEGR